VTKRKRGNGEGSIYRRKDGRWVGQYLVYTNQGPKYRYIYDKSRQAVAEKLTRAVADRDGGLVFDTSALTLSEYLTRWLNDSVRDSVKQRTLENYEYVVRRHLVPALGHIKLKALGPAHVQGLYRSKLDSGLSARTVQLMHTTLHKALKQAVLWGLVPRNVAKAVQAPRPIKKEVQVLSPEEARKFLEVARGDRLEALYLLAITTGLREGELLGLRWRDADLEGRTLSVRQQLTRTNDGISFTTPKRSKTRCVRLTDQAVATLKRHRTAQNAERLKKGGLWQNTGLVFTTTMGTPLNVRSLTYRSFRPLLERAGLPRIRFHDLRHTFATLLLSSRTHPKIVQEMLGHANISQTVDTYSHMLPDMQDRAVEAIESTLRDISDQL
jgi:integrase